MDLRSPKQERDGGEVSNTLVVFKIGTRQPQGAEGREERLVRVGRILEER